MIREQGSPDGARRDDRHREGPGGDGRLPEAERRLQAADRGGPADPLHGSRARVRLTLAKSSSPRARSRRAGASAAVRKDAAAKVWSGGAAGGRTAPVLVATIPINGSAFTGSVTYPTGDTPTYEPAPSPHRRVLFFSVVPLAADVLLVMGNERALRGGAARNRDAHRRADAAHAGGDDASQRSRRAPDGHAGDGNPEPADLGTKAAPARTVLARSTPLRAPAARLRPHRRLLLRRRNHRRRRRDRFENDRASGRRRARRSGDAAQQRRGARTRKNGWIPDASRGDARRARCCRMGRWRPRTRTGTRGAQETRRWNRCTARMARDVRVLRVTGGAAPAGSGRMGRHRARPGLLDHPRRARRRIQTRIRRT